MKKLIYLILFVLISVQSISQNITVQEKKKTIHDLQEATVPKNLEIYSTTVSDLSHVYKEIYDTVRVSIMLSKCDSCNPIVVKGYLQMVIGTEVKDNVKTVQVLNNFNYESKLMDKYFKGFSDSIIIWKYKKL